MWYSLNTLASRSNLLQKGHTQLSSSQMTRSVRSLISPGTVCKVTPDLIAEYSSTLHSFSDISIFIDFAMDSILGTVDASMGSFFIWDEYSKELVLKVARGQGHERLEGSSIKLREGIAGWVAEKGFPIRVHDIRSDSRFSKTKSNDRYRSYSFLSIPLVSENKLIGLINITEKENKQPFSEEDLEHATIFSHHIALAYENLKAKKRLKDENQALNQKISDLSEQLKQQESLASLGRLASHLAHELNNPLDSIRRFVNLALDHINQDSPAREFLLKGKQGIRRSIQVIRGLLELSGLNHRTRTRRTDVHRLIEEVIDSIRYDSGFDQIVIEKRFCDNSLIVEDCGLQTVFQNLFQNAHHAMNGSGTITIQTREQGSYVTVTIKDSGCGIPEPMKTKIFDPFFTTKANGKGTGIGLTICREIIQRSGGNISLENAEKQGAQFTISLPFQSL